MTTPHLNVMDGRPPSVRPAESGGQPASLQFAGPVQVHIHVGGPAAAPPPASAQRSLFLPVLLGLALLGGGYVVGLRSGPALPGPAANAAPENGTVPPPPLLTPPAPLPGPPTVPPALQRQLAKPPSVIPPPGAGAPGRNPFGLKD